MFFSPIELKRLLMVINLILCWESIRNDVSEESSLTAYTLFHMTL